jgi:ssDNA-binding Zn-finger/Zn-ribbon topoisomerase 1
MRNRLWITQIAQFARKDIENNINGSQFLGCSNYPQCDATLNNIQLLNGYIKCDICGGYMVLRNGRYGEFYGCTNYPTCNNTIRIEKKTGQVEGEKK